MSKVITVARAEQHEALHMRLTALLRHAEGVGARQATAAVPDETRRLAEGLLFDAAAFTHGRGLPAAAPSYGALAVQVGQALALLEAFELRYTHWDAGRKCVVWRIAGAERPLPVKRLRPQPVGIAEPKRTNKELDALRAKIAERIEALYRDPA